MENLNLEIRQLLFKISGLPSLQTEAFTDTTPLFQDGLGMDSIDILELVVHLEKKYGVHIRNNEEGRDILQNVKSIVAAIRSQQSQAEPKHESPAVVLA